MCRGYFSSQEIDTHHATEHRSTDQSRNGCRMCCFCHAQPFEITRAKNIKNTLVQRSCQNAKVVEAFCSRRVHHRDRHQHTIPIALAALPGATLPRLRALALFGRRPPQRVDSLLMPASENLHNNGSRGRGLLDRWCRETRRRVTLVVLLCGGRRYRSEVAVGRQAIQKCENRARV